MKKLNTIIFVLTLLKLWSCDVKSEKNECYEKNKRLAFYASEFEFDKVQHSTQQNCTLYFTKYYSLDTLGIKNKSGLYKEHVLSTNFSTGLAKVVPIQAIDSIKNLSLNGVALNFPLLYHYKYVLIEKDSICKYKYTNTKPSFW